MRTIIIYSHLFVLGLIIGLASCAAVKRETRSSAGAAIDCATVTFGAHAAELEALIRAGDWWRVRVRVTELGVTVGGCALTQAVADAVKGLGVAAGPDPAKVRTEYDATRNEVLGGREYRLASGTVR